MAYFRVDKVLLGLYHLQTVNENCLATFRRKSKTVWSDGC